VLPAAFELGLAEPAALALLAWAGGRVAARVAAAGLALLIVVLPCA
jgi:hypothetical protein